MKKCTKCEALTPGHYDACPVCTNNNFVPHKRVKQDTAKLTVVSKEATFGANIMACHSHVKML